MEEITINLENIAFNNSEINLMIELLNEDNRNGSFIKNKIIINKYIDDIVKAIKNLYKEDKSIYVNNLTKTEIFVYFMDGLIKPLLKGKRIKTISILYNSLIKMVNIEIN